MATLFGTLRSVWRGWWSPYFRDMQGHPLWAAVAVTFLFSLAIAVTLTAFVWVFSDYRSDPWRLLWTNFVIAQAIGFSIHGLFALVARLMGAERIDRWRELSRAALSSGVALLGVVIGYAIGFGLIAGVDPRVSFRWVQGWFVGALMIWALLSVFAWSYVRNQVKLAEARQQLANDRARAAELQRQALAAQLRTLQAQIEPHFLFNTLANVASLIDSAPADARRMLEQMIALLRRSLAASRTERVTLAEEAELLRAYLEIVGIRMGPRLRYEIDIPESLGGRTVAPLLLQPLVENAIRHGLEPKVEGGRVRVAARAAGGRLQLEVEDDGLGFGETTQGVGVGLVNLRERLAALYGESASLTIEDRHPGTRVRIALPMEE